ncbi:MAG: hypothetical protein AB2L14_25395 [Candidatus Xenobiia bacterium LiM19]
MQQALDTEGRRFGELDGSVARKCHYCGAIFFRKRNSNRIYCRNSKCRHQARMIGLTRVREPKKREFAPEQVERWNTVMSTAAGWERFRQFMAMNEGR